MLALGPFLPEVFYLTPHSSAAWPWWEIWSPLGTRLTCLLLIFCAQFNIESWWTGIAQFLFPGSWPLSVTSLTFYMEWRDVWKTSKCLQRCSPQEWMRCQGEAPLVSPGLWQESLVLTLKMDVHFSAGYRIDTKYREQDQDVKVGGWLVQCKHQQRQLLSDLHSLTIAKRLGIEVRF